MHFLTWFAMSIVVVEVGGAGAGPAPSHGALADGVGNTGVA